MKIELNAVNDYKSVTAICTKINIMLLAGFTRNPPFISFKGLTKGYLYSIMPTVDYKL